MTIEEIKKLAKVAFEKKSVFKSLGMRNVEQDFDNRLEQAVEYEVAQGEWFKAEKNLRNAQNRL